MDVCRQEQGQRLTGFEATSFGFFFHADSPRRGLIDDKIKETCNSGFSLDPPILTCTRSFCATIPTLSPYAFALLSEPRFCAVEVRLRLTQSVFILTPLAGEYFLLRALLSL